MLRPPFRNWLRLERDARAALARHPRHRRLNGIIGRICCDVGRWAAGAEQFARLIRDQPYLPVMQSQLANALWGAGRLEEAEQTFDRAIALWPDHPAIRFARRDFLALTGRPEIALAQLGTDPVAGPAGDLLAGVYRGLRDASPAAAGAQAEKLLAAVAAGRFGTDSALPFLIALGATAAVFPVLDRYYFGAPGGPAGASEPPGPWSRRETDMLFRPTAAPLWRDRRFDALTQRIGLADYWRATGTAPDYRRGSA